MGSYNQYKARGCSYAECKSQHMLHFGTLGTGHYLRGLGGGGGATKRQGWGKYSFTPTKEGGSGKKF